MFSEKVNPFLKASPFAQPGYISYEPSISYAAMDSYKPSYPSSYDNLPSQTNIYNNNFDTGASNRG